MMLWRGDGVGLGGAFAAFAAACQNGFFPADYFAAATSLTGVGPRPIVSTRSLLYRARLDTRLRARAPINHVIVGVVSVLAAFALGYFLLFMDFETMEAQAMEARARLARRDVNEHNFEMYPASKLSDAEVKEGMAAAGVDLRALDEFLSDKVPTEFDLDPSELRYNNSDIDIDGICY